MWIGAGAKLAAPRENHLEFEPNVLAIKGSPIGKTIALAVQGDIDFAWHEGVSNPFEVCGSCGEAGCGHDHSGHDHGSCSEDCDHHSHDSAVAESSADLPWLRQQVDKLTAVAYQSNSPYGLTERHRKHIRETVERKVAFAHDLDPENYLNYNTLHLFYETALGNDLKNAEQLIELAKETRASVRGYTVDPEPWVTAASTQLNICQVIVNHLGMEGNERKFVEHLNDMRNCLIRFDQLRQEKILNGGWEKIAEPRRAQMMERFRMAILEHSAQYTIFKRLNTADHVADPYPPLQIKPTAVTSSH